MIYKGLQARDRRVLGEDRRSDHHDPHGPSGGRDRTGCCLEEVRCRFLPWPWGRGRREGGCTQRERE